MTKQVIVMRMDLNMSVGKMIAQGAHAAMAPLTREGFIGASGFMNYNLSGSLDAWNHWLTGSFTKVVCYVNSEEELLTVLKAAREAKLPSELIIDNGTTEFNGVKTATCISVGPALIQEIDKVTGSLPLLSIYPKKKKTNSSE